MRAAPAPSRGQSAITFEMRFAGTSRMAQREDGNQLSEHVFGDTHRPADFLFIDAEQAGMYDVDHYEYAIPIDPCRPDPSR